MDINHTSECSTPSREYPRPSNDDDIGHKCRELVDHIRSYTYLMKDQAALQGLYDSLLVAYENILQHNRNQSRITVEGMEEHASYRDKRESWNTAEPLVQTSPEIEASDECRIIGKVVVGQQCNNTLEGDIVGSYVVCDNVLSLVKPEVHPTQEQKMEEDKEPQFPFSPKVYKRCQNNPPKSEKTVKTKDLKVEEKSRRTTVEGESRAVEERRIVSIETDMMAKDTSALERLKCIPPEVFKLLMPVEEKPKPSRFNAEVLETKGRVPSKTFRILIPVKNNKRRCNSPSQNQIAKNRHDEDTDSFTTYAVKSPERKRQKVSDMNDIQSCTRMTRSVQYTGIHQNDLTSEKRERTSIRIIISGKEKT